MCHVIIFVLLSPAPYCGLPPSMLIVFHNIQSIPYIISASSAFDLPATTPLPLCTSIKMRFYFFDFFFHLSVISAVHNLFFSLLPLSLCGFCALFVVSVVFFGHSFFKFYYVFSFYFFKSSFPASDLRIFGLPCPPVFFPSPYFLCDTKCRSILVITIDVLLRSQFLQSD